MKNKKRIRFEDLTAQEFLDLEHDQLEHVDFPKDLFYSPELIEKINKMNKKENDTVIFAKGKSFLDGLDIG